METENTLEVALVKEICLICGQEVDGPIIMNQILTENRAKEVKELNGKVIGFAEEPCAECKKNMELAFMIIGFDEEKSDLDNLPQGFFRTGDIIGVKKDIPLVQEFIKEKQPSAIDKGFIFMPKIVMEQLNLISINN